MGRPRRGRMAWLVAFGAALAGGVAWLATNRAPDPADAPSGAQRASVGSDASEAGLAAHPAARATRELPTAPAAPAHPAPCAWEVVPVPPRAAPLVVETAPFPPVGGDAFPLLVATSPNGALLWLGLIGGEDGPPQYWFSSPPRTDGPLAPLAEGGALTPDGSWRITASLLPVGRWLLRLAEYGSSWEPARPPLAWAWAEVGPDAGPLRLVPADPARMGRLRAWVRAHPEATAGCAVSVFVRGCLWATWCRAAGSPEEAARDESLVPADEDLVVTVEGAPGLPRGMRRVVRVPAGGVETVGFEVPPVGEVRLVVPRAGVRAGRASVRYFRVDAGGAASPGFEDREEAPSVHLRRLAPGAYLAVAWGPALAGHAAARFEVAPPVPTHVDLPLVEEGSVVTLRVLDLAGAPLVGEWLEVGRLRTADPLQALSDRVATDGGGLAELGPLAPGPLDLVVPSRGWIGLVEVPRESGRTVEVRVPPKPAPADGVRLAVAVEAADGTPWPNGPAVLTRVGDAWGRFVEQCSYWRGGFELAGVAPGDYLLEFPATCLWAGRTQSVSVPLCIPADAPSGLDLRVRPRTP